MTYNYEHREHEEEDSYFVSMTDIMVGMLFVFIILLMYFVFRIQITSEPMVPLSQHKALIVERDVAKSRVKELEAEVERLNKNPLERYLKAADAARETILRELEKSMDDAGIEVKIIPEQGILRLSGDLLFPNAKSSIDADSASDKAVKALGAALVKVLPCFSLGPQGNPTKRCNPNATFIDAVFIEGHTDNSPISGILEGNIKDNLSLSARRATNAVLAVYAAEPRLKGMWSISPIQSDVPLGEGTSPLVNAAAFGDTRPAFSNETEAGKARNRRIDLRLLMYSPRTENLETVRKLLDK